MAPAPRTNILMPMKLAKALGVPLLIVALGLLYGAWSARKWPADHGAHGRLLECIASHEGGLDLTTITPFHWTRLEIFGPYSSKEQAERRLGFPWTYEWSAVDMLDDRDFFVFVDSQRVATAFEVLHREAGVDRLPKTI